MLTRGRVYMSQHLQAAFASIRLFRHKPIATIMTIVVIAITLTLPTLFWVLTYNIERFTTNSARFGHISLYLKLSLDAQQSEEVLSRVRRAHGVAFATLTSPEEGLRNLQTQEGMQDIMTYLPENPLPSVIDVTPSLTMDNVQKLERLYFQLKAYPEVAQAKIDLHWIKRLQAVLSFVESVTHGLMLLLALAVMLIVGNTLRLVLHSHHEEIQVLKLIGAADSFILRPFLYSGIWYGLSGAIVAALFVHVFILSLAMAANGLATAFQMHYSLTGLTLWQILCLLGTASILGWLGARFSVKHQLTSIEP